MSDKTNIQCLRSIIKELTVSNAAKEEEANEFLDAIEQELKEVDDKDDEITSLESKLDESAAEIRELEEEADLANVEELGLDTLRWELDNGNLRIQQEMENFIDVLKKKYIGVTA